MAACAGLEGDHGDGCAVSVVSLREEKNAGAGAQIGSAGPKGQKGVMRAFTLLKHS